MNCINKIKIGILGGSFDPPTIAHALMAAELLNLHIVDQIIFVPCGDRSDKELTKGTHRIKMLEHMIESMFILIVDIFSTSSNIQINDIEVKNGRMIPTYYMLQQLQQQYENIYFVMGSDLLSSLHQWEEGEKLKKEMNFIILNRNTNSLENFDVEHLPKNYILMPNFEYGISSTDVRKRIKNAQTPYLDSIGMVTKSVLEYIIRHNLYKES